MLSVPWKEGSLLCVLSAALVPLGFEEGADCALIPELTTMIRNALLSLVILLLFYQIKQ